MKGLSHTCTCVHSPSNALKLAFCKRGKFICLEGEVWEEIFTKILIEISLEGEILDHFDFCSLCL